MADPYSTSPGTYGVQRPRSSWGGVSDWGGMPVNQYQDQVYTNADLAGTSRPSDATSYGMRPPGEGGMLSPMPQQQAYAPVTSPTRSIQDEYAEFLRTYFPYQEQRTIGGESLGIGKTGGTGGGALRYSLADIAAGQQARNQPMEDYRFVDPSRGGQMVTMSRPAGSGAPGYGQGGPSIMDIMGSPRIQGMNMMYDVAGQRVQRGVGDMMQRAGLLQSGHTAEELSGQMQDLESQRAAVLGPMLQDEISRQAAGQYAMQQGLLPGYMPPPQQPSGMGGMSPFNAQQAMQMLGAMGGMQPQQQAAAVPVNKPFPPYQP